MFMSGQILELSFLKLNKTVLSDEGRITISAIVCPKTLFQKRPEGSTYRALLATPPHKFKVEIVRLP